MFGEASQARFRAVLRRRHRLRPGALERLRRRPGRDTVLASLMVRLRCDSAAERWFVPAFVFFFQMLYPFAKVNDPTARLPPPPGGDAGRRRGAGASGRPRGHSRRAYRRLRARRPDEVARADLAGTYGAARSLRPYPGFRDMERMVTRSAYAQLGYSPLRLVGAVLGMIVVYLAPPLFALFGDRPGARRGADRLPLMAQAYMPACAFTGFRAARALALPLVAACYTWFTLESARQLMRRPRRRLEGPLSGAG